MFNTSKDLLYLVIAFCILWLTVFMCWLLYYFISIIGSVRRLVKSAEDKVNKIGEVIELLKDRINHSAAHLALIVEGVSKLVDYFKSRRSPDSRSGKKKKAVIKENETE